MQLSSKINNENVVGDFVAKLVDASCMQKGGGNATTELAPSERPGTTGQGIVLAGDVQVDEEEIPAEVNQEARKDTTLDKSKDPEVTPVTCKSSRGRPRCIFAAAWSGVKGLLLCGYCRRE